MISYNDLQEEDSDIIAGRIRTAVEYGLTVMDAAFDVHSISPDVQGTVISLLSSGFELKVLFWTTGSSVELLCYPCNQFFIFFLWNVGHFRII